VDQVPNILSVVPCTDKKEFAENTRKFADMIESGEIVLVHDRIETVSHPDPEVQRFLTSYKHVK